MPVITVDFAGVEVGGGRVRIPEGDYGFRIDKVVVKKGEESGKSYLDMQFKVIKGNAKGLKKVLRHSCSLQPQSLWNLKNLIESCDKQVPSKAVKLSTEKMVGWECGGTVIDDEYEGKKKSIISAFFPMADLGKTSTSGEDLDEATGEEEVEETEELEETDKKDKKKKGKKKEDVEEEEAAEEDDLFN